MHEFLISFCHTEWYSLDRFFSLTVGARKNKHAHAAATIIGIAPEVTVKTI